MMHAVVFLVSVMAADVDHTIDPAIPFFPRQYVCCRVRGSIEIDGKLDDPAWEKAKWTSDFVDIERLKGFHRKINSKPELFEQVSLKVR